MPSRGNVRSRLKHCGGLGKRYLPETEQALWLRRFAVNELGTRAWAKKERWYTEE